MSLKLDKAYLAVNFPNEVAEVGTNWAQCEKSLDTQKELALTFLPERVNEVLENIKRAAAENKTSCVTWISFNGIEFNQKWQNAFKNIFQKTLKVTIHDPIMPRGQHEFNATWEPQQNKAIKHLLGIGQNPVQKFDENQKMNAFRKEQKHKYCDFTFLIRDKEFPIHKIIVAKSSPFLDSIFSACEEGNIQQPIEFGSDALSPEMFETFLEYLYTGLIDLGTNDIAYVIELASLANMTQVQSLIDLCYSHLTQSIKEDNFYLIAKHATIEEEPQLIASCKKFITQNPNCVDKIDISKMAPSELVGCYNIASLLGSEKLIKSVLGQINAAMNKDTFQAFCQSALNQQSKELREIIKKSCHAFASVNNELLLSEPMKEARKTYEKLMTMV